MKKIKRGLGKSFNERDIVFITQKKSNQFLNKAKKLKFNYSAPFMISKKTFPFTFHTVHTYIHSKEI